MNSNIGEIISQARQNCRMTQEEFASRLGVTPQAVSKWERGNGLPDLSLVEGICRVLGINANALLGINAGKVVEGNDLVMEREIRNSMFAEPLVVEFGTDLIPCIVEGLKTDYVNQRRKELVKNTGMLMPLLRLRDNVALKEQEVRITSYDRLLWTEERMEVNADTFGKLLDQVVEECRKHYDTILNKQIVKNMVDNLKEQYPGVADGLVPERISYLQMQRRLQEKLQRGESIRDLIHILEELEEELERRHAIL